MNYKTIYFKKRQFFLLFFFFGVFHVSYAQENELNSLKSVNSSEDYVNFYQKYISDLRGNSCPMYPSCSNYTLEIIKSKGVISGLIEGSDRLLRCGHEHEKYNLTYQEKGFKLIDLPNGDQERQLIFKIEKPSFTYNSTYNDTTVNLIANLINEGLYSEAMIEINKKKVLSKDFSFELVAFEMLCLNAMKKYEKVILNYDNLTIEGKNYISIIKQLFKSHYKLGNFNELIKLRSILDGKDINDYRVRQLNNLIFISYLKEDRPSDAQTFMAKRVSNVNERQSIDTTISQLYKLKKKSPTIAKVSSIIPGLGYVYTGHVMTGISALIINSLLGYATYSSFKSGNNGIGILTGILGVGFYFGNIQGAGKSAIRENEYQKEIIIKKFENQTIVNN